MRAEARAEVDAEDLVRADDYYHSRPYFRSADKPVDHYARFCSTPAEDFYKKPVLCAAHVVGIADPVKYRKSNEVGDPRGLKEKLIDQIRAIQADLRNAQATLVYHRGASPCRLGADHADYADFSNLARPPKTMPEKMSIMKFDPKARKHVEYKEIKLK